MKMNHDNVRSTTVARVISAHKAREQATAINSAAVGAHRHHGRQLTAKEWRRNTINYAIATTVTLQQPRNATKNQENLAIRGAKAVMARVSPDATGRQHHIGATVIDATTAHLD